MILTALLAAALALQEAPPPAAAAAPPAALPSAADLEISSTAPKDDYGLTAWCQGAVQGHLELFQSSEPMLLEAARKRGEKNVTETRRLDEALMQDERDFLAQFGRALAAADKASVTNQKDQADAARAQGLRIWAAIRQADDNTKVLMVPYWGVPSRCITTAKRLEEKSLLFAQALQQNQPAEAPAAAADQPPPAEEPAPPPAPATEQNAAAPPPAGPDAPK